jgi:hypothetical protein
MQRRASSRYGPRIAWVGQISMQRLQLPQCALAGVIDRQRQIGIQLAEKKVRAGAFRLISTVCLPIQPRPALRASAFSSTGAEST